MKTLVPDYSVTEVCTLLSVTPPTIYKLLASGKLDGYKVGRARRITGESIQRLRRGGSKNTPCTRG